MRTTLDHLSKDKQNEIQRIVRIIFEVVSPEMIILFGSHAAGTQEVHRNIGSDGVVHEYVSDYDFLVVTRNNAEKTSVQESTIMDRVDHSNPPLNLEIHEVDFVNEGLRKGQSFFIAIVQDGISLYDSGEVAFVEPHILTREEQRNRAQQYFDTWVPAGWRFLKVARFCLGEGDLNTGVFNLHQAAESLYYGTLLVFSGYKPKTHNLWTLRKKTKAYSKDLFMTFRGETDEHDRHLFDLLKRGYVDARYKPERYLITRPELAELIGRVETMSSIVARVCRDRIQTYE